MTTISQASAASIRSLPLSSMVVLSLGALDYGLEQSLVIPALPALAEHYDATIAATGWLATAFLLSGIVAVPLFGRLSDLYGKRRLLLVALGSFVIGSLMCAITHSIEIAIAGRAVQGLGTAVATLTYALARDTLPPELLTRAIGAVVGAASLGGAIGLVISGPLVDHISPAAIFWFLVFLATPLLVALVLIVRETPVRASASLDVGGAATLAVGLFTLVLAISKGNSWGWSSERITGLFAVAAVSLGVFALIESRVRQPLVDLALVVKRPFVSANACAFVFGFSFFIATFVVPVIAGTSPDSGYGQGLSTTETGLLMLPQGITFMLGGLLGGRIVDTVGPRALIATGSALAAVSYLSLTLGHGSWLQLALPTCGISFGAGLILTGLYPVVIRGASTDKTGIAIAMNVLVRNTAVVVGVAASFAVIEGAGLSGDFPSDAGFTSTFAIGAIGATVTLFASALMPGRASQHVATDVRHA